MTKAYVNPHQGRSTSPWNSNYSELTVPIFPPNMEDIHSGNTFLTVKGEHQRDPFTGDFNMGLLHR
jgi:hypothetical protein